MLFTCFLPLSVSLYNNCKSSATSVMLPANLILWSPIVSCTLSMDIQASPYVLQRVVIDWYDVCECAVGSTYPDRGCDLSNVSEIACESLIICLPYSSSIAARFFRKKLASYNKIRRESKVMNGPTYSLRLLWRLAYLP